VENGNVYPIITTRAGGDANGGGQILNVSVAIQLRLDPKSLRMITLQLQGYNSALSLYAGWCKTAVTNTAQNFANTQFYTEREAVASAFKDAMNAKLKGKGAYVEMLELMKIEFNAAFEDTLIQTQVAKETTAINQWSQHVAYWTQQIGVQKSYYSEQIAKITGAAKAKATAMVASATGDAFSTIQKAKAESFNSLKTELGLSTEQFAEYIKIRSLVSQSSVGNKVTVSVAPPYVTDSGGRRLDVSDDLPVDLGNM
jgi:regulator of protease activity HflC (stomatin/prohibitin superfamily)